MSLSVSDREYRGYSHQDLENGPLAVAGLLGGVAG